MLDVDLIVSTWAKRWPHFMPNEVLSPDQLHLLLKRGVMPYSEHALDALEQFRIFCQQPLVVNTDTLERRGARSIKEVLDINNSAEKTSRVYNYSFHLWCAFDVSSPKLTSDEVWELAVKFGKWGGIGRYDTFTHVDCRFCFGGPSQLWDLRTKRI